MTVRRSRTLPVARAAVWTVVGDPHHLPRWWPLTERVEAVDTEAWTSVLRSARGRAVRLDYRVEAHEPPRRRAWSQQLAGSPFERLLREHRTEVTLADAGDGTTITLTVQQRARDGAPRQLHGAARDAAAARRGARRARRDAGVTLDPPIIPGCHGGEAPRESGDLG